MCEMGPTRVDGRRRVAACLSLLAVAIAVVMVLVGLRGQVNRLLASLALAAITSAGGCQAEGHADDRGVGGNVKGT